LGRIDTKSKGESYVRRNVGVSIVGEDGDSVKARVGVLVRFGRFFRGGDVTRASSQVAGGSGASFGRLRLVLLAVVAAAFLLVSAAQAAAANLTVEIAGSGEGEVSSAGGLGPGSEPIEGTATEGCESFARAPAPAKAIAVVCEFTGWDMGA